MEWFINNGSGFINRCGLLLPILLRDYYRLNISRRRVLFVDSVEGVSRCRRMLMWVSLLSGRGLYTIVIFVKIKQVVILVFNTMWV